MLRARTTIALALPLLLAAPSLAQPQAPQGGWPNRGRCGMEVQSMTDALREFFAAPADRGVLVARVIPERAAAKAGIQVGDVLTKVGGESIAEPLDLIAAVAKVPAGETLALELVRKGEAQSVTIAPEGEPVEFARPEHGGKQHGEFHEEMRRGLRDHNDEILNRLDAIEQRLDRLAPQQ
jgi:serine protease Do